MKKSKERRDAPRHAIRVLVNCLPAGTPSKRNGHESHGWEMWAKDLGDDGVGLQWSLQWSSGRCPHCLEAERGKSRDKSSRTICQSVSPASQLKQGQEIQLDGLVYDDRGSQTMVGRIQWVHEDKGGKKVEFGVLVTSPEHRDFFKALEG